MKPAIERRYFKSSEIRMMKDPEKKPMMKGMAALFNTLSVDLGGFRERIAPGFFANALNKSDVRCLWNHDSNHVLGRSASGTLRLAETNDGLQIENDMPDTMCSRDLQIMMDRGDVNQMSFGFITKTDSWDEVDGEVVRTLIECEELFDVSAVTFAAYPDTQVGLRSLEEYKKSAAVPPGGNGGANDPAIITGLMRRKLELKSKFFGGV